jgi:uncharacterized protein YlzI (FlbEa/FlbD family)
MGELFLLLSATVKGKTKSVVLSTSIIRSMIEHTDPDKTIIFLDDKKKVVVNHSVEDIFSIIRDARSKKR